MHKICLFLLLLYSLSGYAGQSAVTDTGERVILNSDGTWQYADSGKSANKKIQTNPKQFHKPDSAKFLLKSTRNKSAFWLDTGKWSFKKAENADSSAEYEFRLKGKDLYGQVITEQIEVKLESLADIALENARSAAPDARVIQQEYRVVNGHKVIYLEIRGTIQSIRFTYLGYYYSDASGSTQFIAYTASTLVDKFKPEIYGLLNGLITQ
jgi:hypothetical protein